MDATFIPHFVPQTYADRVQRAAVLYKLYRPLPDPQQVRVHTLRLVKLWRWSLRQLWDQHWHNRPRGLQFARNCCPSFVYCTPRTRSCGLARICPFCYARWVRDVWETVDLAFPNLNSRQVTEEILLDDGTAREPRRLEVTLPADTTPYALVERRHEFNLPFLPTDHYRDLAARAHYSVRPRRKRKTPREEALLARDLPAFERHLRECLQAATTARNGWMAKLHPVGALYHTTVEPWADCWHVEHRQLLMLRPDQQLDPQIELQTRGLFARHEQPSRRLLFEAVIRACAYPKLLLRGDYELTGVLLRARRRVRLTANYGAFRQA